MALPVRILPRAEKDIANIFAWLFERSPAGAHSWLSDFELAVTQLQADAHAYGFAPETGLRGFELRQLLFRTRRGRTYRGIYTLQDNVIYLLRVRGPGQAPLTPSDLDEPTR